MASRGTDTASVHVRSASPSSSIESTPSARVPSLLLHSRTRGVAAPVGGSASLLPPSSILTVGTAVSRMRAPRRAVTAMSNTATSAPPERSYRSCVISADGRTLRAPPAPPGRGMRTHPAVPRSPFLATPAPDLSTHMKENRAAFVLPVVRRPGHHRPDP